MKILSEGTNWLEIDHWDQCTRQPWPKDYSDRAVKLAATGKVVAKARSKPSRLRFAIDNTALDDASIQHIDNKQAAFPDG